MSRRHKGLELIGEFAKGHWDAIFFRIDSLCPEQKKDLRRS